MTKPKSTPIYSNCLLLAPDGQPMCRCGDNRAYWYMDRGLATKISDNPLTVRLKFIPKGLGKAGDPYYLAWKENRCVCCGTYDGINRHHIVPHCFRQYFPENIKNHSSYDIVPLCIPCHERYETEAFKLKQKLAVDYDCSFHGKGTKFDYNLLCIKKSATAILKHGQFIPADKLEKLWRVLKNYYGHENVTPAELDAAHNIDPMSADGDYLPYGEYIVKHVPNLQQFVMQWRKHFVDTMCPSFMPIHWDINRDLELG